MKKLLKKIIIGISVLAVLFVAAVFFLGEDEDDYYDDDTEFAEMFYDRYGYYPEGYENGDDENYYDYDDYYDEDYDSGYADYDIDDSIYEDYQYDDADYYDEEYYASPAPAATEYSNPSVNSKSADWTVLIYLCGTDLESKSGGAIADIKEMLTAKHGSNVNVIVETGGTAKWNGFNISPKSLQRWKIADGKFTKVGETKLASMGASSTLTDFINWGVKNYPAKKYVLEFWDHGSGSITGVCYDELYDSDSLYVYEMKEALEAANVHFEAAVFDTCLTATIEVADALSGYTDYLIASEEVLYGGCLGYAKWLTSLSEHPEWTGADLGKLIGPMYKANMAKIDLESEYTMSTIDLSKISELKKAFSAMASKMNAATQNVTSFKNLVKVGSRVQKYGASSPLEGYTNLIDLGDFANNASAEVPVEAAELIKAIKHAVVWEGHGSNKNKSSGIAVYYPIKYQGEGDEYAKTTNNKEYLRYLDTILDKWTAPSWVYSDARARSVTPKKSQEYKVEFETYLAETDDGPYYAVEITSGNEIVKTVDFSLYMYVEEDDEYYYLGMDNDIAFDADNDAIYYDNFNAEWVMFGDNFVNLEIIEENDEFNIYSIPVELNGNESNLRVRYDLKKDKFTVLGAYDGLENGASSKGMRKLKEGDKINLIYPVYSATNDEFTNYVDTKTYTWNGKNKIKFTSLNKGTYLYQFSITDLFGNIYDSDFITMYYDGKNLTLETDEEID